MRPDRGTSTAETKCTDQCRAGDRHSLLLLWLLLRHEKCLAIAQKNDQVLRAQKTNAHRKPCHTNRSHTCSARHTRELGVTDQDSLLSAKQIMRGKRTLKNFRTSSSIDRIA